MSIMGLFKKKIGPKIFAIVLEGEKHTLLSFIDEYDFEEALSLAQERFKKKYPGESRPNLSMYCSEDLQALLDKYSEEKVSLAQIKK